MVDQIYFDLYLYRLSCMTRVDDCPFLTQPITLDYRKFITVTGQADYLQLNKAIS